MPPKKTKQNNLSEAKVMADMKESGASLSEIAQRLGVSKTTVSRRLQLWAETVGPETEEDRDRLESAQVIISTVQGILKDAKIAERLGEITGADIATIERTLQRIRARKATKKEIFNIFSNIGGVIRGFIEGEEIHKALKLPDRESLADRKEVEDLKKEVKELKALVIASTSGSRSKRSQGSEAEAAEEGEEEKEDTEDED